MRKNKIIIIFFTLIITIVFSFIFFVKSLNRVDIIEKKLAKNDYIQSLCIYETISDKNVKEKADTLFYDKCSQIENDFKNNNIDYFSAVTHLKQLKEIKAVRTKADNCESNIEEIKMSHDAYNAALNSIDHDDYKKAMSQLNAVIKEDTLNYNNARKKLNELYLKAQKTKLYDAYDCKVVYSNSNMKSIYKDQIQFKLLNKGDKEIKNFNVCFIAYDYNNKPIQIKCSTNYNQSYYIICTGQNVHVQPQETWGDGTMGWNIDDSSKIKFVKAEIKEIEYYDNTIWKNPLYNIWLDENLKNTW